MSTTTGLFFISTVLLISAIIMYCCDGSPANTFVLEKKMDFKTMKHSELVSRDRARHHHIFFQRSSSSSSSMHHDGYYGVVVNLTLMGSSDAYKYGFYFTRVKLGNPSKEYHLLIDTASDITWVNCNPCIGCPHTSTIIPLLRAFDPRNSSSAHPLSCSSPICMTLPYSACSSDSPRCGFSIGYKDGTEASGYYLRDTFHFDTIMGNSTKKAGTTSTDIVFGCTNHQSGSLTKEGSAIDGALGLGPGDMSFISQLDSRGIMPSVFSHCLNGEENGGGGILILGEILEPSIVYSPIVPQRTQYNLNLLSISIRGKIVPIDPIVFSTSRQETIVDSGTTYAYLTEEAYDPFITALVDVVPPSVSSFAREGDYCFQVSNSLRDVFPLVSLNFEGDASMVLKPEEYLLPHHNEEYGLWCVGFKKSQGLTILGELILKDKVIVYDLALQRIGWADYDCSLSVNVSLVPPRVSCSPRDATLHQFLMGSLYIILMFVIVCVT